MSRGGPEQGEKEKPISFRLCGVKFDRRFGLVHCPSRPSGREPPDDPWRSALRHERRDHARPARSSIDSRHASNRALPLPSCACHSLLKAFGLLKRSGGPLQLFKRDSTRSGENNELVCGKDVTAVLGCLIVDLLRTERPLHLHLGASVVANRARHPQVRDNEIAF
jgi:hypothetical protein